MIKLGKLILLVEVIGGKVVETPTHVEDSENHSIAEPLAVASGCYGQLSLETHTARPKVLVVDLLAVGILILTLASAGYRERFCN